jgi:hypothetical protein
MRTGNLQARTLSGAAPREWQKDVCPGCYFIRFLPEKDITIYGEVLEQPPNEDLDGYLPTMCYSRAFPEGVSLQTPLATMAKLLSKEQFDMAAKLHWPGDEENLLTIFETPPT